MKRLVARLRRWAAQVRDDLRAIEGCARDPRVPRLAKILALLVLAYALSPIDLIPDMIPVIGHVDDLILVPLGILLVMRLIPKEVLDEHRRAATAPRPDRSRSWLGVALVLGLWLSLAAGLALLVAGDGLG